MPVKFLLKREDISLHQTYKGAGVNVDAGDEFVRRIKRKLKSTHSKAVLGDVGLFGAFFQPNFHAYKSPVLVSSVDGVGTKLRVAILMDKHDTIGQDLVNHCVNDIAVCGAKPLFFVDYFATGKLNPLVGEKVVEGFVKACIENNCSLVGGETAEMPGFYGENEYDLAGTIVGIVEKKKIFDGSKVRAGDVLIGLPSTGLHTNGYSLARPVLFERHEVDDYIEELGTRLGDALLSIHRSYLRPIESISKLSALHGLAHITGGGIAGNTKRLLTRGLVPKIDWNSWERPAIFRLIQKEGNVPEKDMRATFNLGVGLVIVAAKNGATSLIGQLKKMKERPFVLGEIVKA